MKILILRFSSMGDILLATPVLDVLKKKYPDCEIHWVVNKKFEESLNTNPLVAKLMIFKDGAGLKNIKKEIRSTEYDLIFDLHRNSKTRYLSSGKKNVFSYNKRVFERFMLVHFKMPYKQIIPIKDMYFSALEKAGIDTVGTWKPRFGLSKALEAGTVNQFNLHNLNYIAFVPGASYFTKTWPAEYFAALGKRIIGTNGLNRKIIVLGKGTSEEAAAKVIKQACGENCIDLAGRLDLQQTATVLKFADIVVTNDNGPMHLAECFGKKIVAIFGSTTEEFGFFPYSTEHKVLEAAGLKCRPCTHFGRRKCPKGHFKCMKDITPENVYEAVTEMLK